LHIFLVFTLITAVAEQSIFDERIPPAPAGINTVCNLITYRAYLTMSFPLRGTESRPLSVKRAVLILLLSSGYSPLDWLAGLPNNKMVLFSLAVFLVNHRCYLLDLGCYYICCFIVTICCATC